MLFSWWPSNTFIWNQWTSIVSTILTAALIIMHSFINSCFLLLLNTLFSPEHDFHWSDTLSIIHRFVTCNPRYNPALGWLILLLAVDCSSLSLLRAHVLLFHFTPPPFNMMTVMLMVMMMLMTGWLGFLDVVCRKRVCWLWLAVQCIEWEYSLYGENTTRIMLVSSHTTLAV